MLRHGRTYTLIAILVTALLLPLFSRVSEADMVPSNVLTRVFSVRLGNEQATAFAIEVNQRQYLITARHLLDSAPSATSIDLLRDSTWKALPFRRLAVDPASVDIAVMVMSEQLGSLLPVKYEFNGTSLSEQVFFLGFPFRLFIQGRSLNAGFPLPLVKHGIIASLEAGGLRGQPFLIDGINNPGFSGGPVVRLPSGSHPVIIGVVSGYHVSQEPVYQGATKTAMSVQANTGLVVAYAISYALEAIAKDPSGFRIVPARD